MDQPRVIIDLPPIPPNVTKVRLTNIVQSCNINSLSRCAQLAILQITRCPNIIALSSLLSQLPQLEFLEINLSDVHKLPYLPQCTKLKEIALRGIHLDKFAEDIPQLIQSVSVLPSECCVRIKDFNENSEEIHNQLTDAVVQLWRHVSQINYTGPDLENIIFNGHPVSDLLPASSLLEQVATWMEESNRNWNWVPWRTIGQEEGADALAQLLTKLRETAEYQNEESRPNFRARVCNLLEQLQNNEVLRENCITQAHQASETCGDRAAIVFLNMEKNALVSQAESDVQNGSYDGLQFRKLIDLGKGMYRLAKLEAIAQEKIAALRKKWKAENKAFEEDEEVHLAYIVEAAKRFPLPVKVNAMKHRPHAEINNEDIKIAIELLKSTDTKVHDPNFLKFLANWRPMQKCLKRFFDKTNPDLYQKLESDIETKIESEKADLGSKLENLDKTNEQKYREESDKLMQKCNALNETVTSEMMLYPLSKILAEHKITASLEEPTNSE